jgi:2-desacetyl-2-hydroxyethyl bacteriochlorophyllide A dehydrogenase
LTRLTEPEVSTAESLSGQAVWFTAPGSVELRDEIVPHPGDGEVRVRALCSAISHGTEMLVYRGQIPPGTTLDLPTLAGDFAFPIKYGYASVGTVTETGHGVTTLAVGDLVFCLHPHQTHYVIAADLAWRLPPELAPERAVFAANVETALNALLDAPIRLGERVAVVGQGTVGLLIGLLARRNGAGTVAVLDPIERRRELAASLGADVALDPAGAGPADVADALGSRPDVVFEASGNPAALQLALDAVADEGTVLVCSWYGTKGVMLNLGDRFHRGRIRVRSTQVGRIGPEISARWDYARRRATVIELLAHLPLNRLVSHRFAVEDAADAYRLVAERPAETLQVVLTYGEHEQGAP